MTSRTDERPSSAWSVDDWLTDEARALDPAAPLEALARDGYARLGPILNPAGCEALRARCDALMLGEVRHEGLFFQPDATTGRYEDAPLGLGWTGPSVDYRKLEKLELDPLFLAWMSNPLFARLSRASIGESARLYRAIIFNKGQAGGSDIPWHQDGGKLWGLSRDPALQLWTALDDAPLDGGCLEVVPGTHRRGLATPLGGVVPTEQSDAADAEARAIALPVKAGEGLLIHNLVWHRSGRGRPGQRRRAFSVCLLHPDTQCLRKRKAPRIFRTLFDAP